MGTTTQRQPPLTLGIYRIRNHGYFSRLPTQALCFWCEESILPEKRAFEAGRQESNTRIGAKRIHLVRTRGGNRKFRALRLDSGPLRTKPRSQTSKASRS